MIAYDYSNVFSGNNYTIKIAWLPNDVNIWWDIDCSYMLGDWIETQDSIEWALIGQRHQSKYRITDNLLSKIKMMTALTENNVRS